MVLSGWFEQPTMDYKAIILPTELREQYISKFISNRFTIICITEDNQVVVLFDAFTILEEDCFVNNYSSTNTGFI